MSGEIAEFVQTCKGCQLWKPEKSGDRAPITPIVRPELPFEIVNIDVRTYSTAICQLQLPSGNEDKYGKKAGESPLTASKQKAYGDFNKRSSVKNFSIGEQVVLLIPD
ncbi:hypothetical protein TNCV_299061 [Trichonephila clavipes]|nr:hypothetical protein TNCV_299061 [Trichonephila clavipes]